MSETMATGDLDLTGMEWSDALGWAREVLREKYPPAARRLLALADRMEEIAWAIPAPNEHTPKLMMLVIELRRAALSEGEG